jgi:hypothetical protein
LGEQNINEQESYERIVTKGEECLAKSVRTLLGRVTTGDKIEESDDFREFLCDLEWYIPEVLREIHSEWKTESLDAVFPLVTRKTGEREVVVFGQCILITDQTFTPIYVKLQIHSSEDKVTWLECKLGETDPRGKLHTKFCTPSSIIKKYRLPHHSPNSKSRNKYYLEGMIKQLYSLEGKEDLIDWAYMVTFGEKDD